MPRRYTRRDKDPKRHDGRYKTLQPGYYRAESRRFEKRLDYKCKVWDMNTSLNQSDRSYCSSTWAAIEEYAKYYDIW